MGINQKAIQLQVAKALNEYGTEFTVYRDIYNEDELGCKELTESMKEIGTIVGVLDNSSSSKEAKNEQKGIVKATSSATLYMPYSEDILIQPGDYIGIENIYYKLKPFTDIIHYNILYQIQVEGVELNE